MNEPHKDEIVPASAGWYVAYAIRVTMDENAQHIKECREALASDETDVPGVMVQSVKGALAHAESLRGELFDAFAKLPEALRPDPQRYPREIIDPSKPVPVPLELPELSEEEWRKTVRANGHVGDLIGNEEAAYIEATRNPRGPGLGEADRFEEVTIAEDEWSHGRTVGDALTWCGMVPVGLLPKPTGVYCPHCYGHNGMN